MKQSFAFLFCLVPRASVLHGTNEHCMSVGLSHVGPWLFSFYSMQKVSGQQILEVCLRILKGFHRCLEISCSHPCFKEKQILKVQMAWIPDCLPSSSFIIIYIFFLFKREILEKFFIFTVHHFF